jgi:integrase
MGSILMRNDGRCVIQWFDGSGRQRQESLPRSGQDGRPLTAKGLEKEARRRLREYEAQALRHQHGLDPLPSDSLEMPFGDLLDWWWEQKGKTLRSTMVRPFLEKHLRSTIGLLRLREVTTTRLQRLLADKVDELAPKSLNHLRAFLFNIFATAKKPGGPWAGRANPVAEVERFKVVPKPKKILAPEEWAPVLAQVPEEWRGPVATGLYAVLREGEIFGLRKEDVDLGAGIIMVCRSWDAPRTKDGKALPVPIADALRPYLEKALRTAPGELVFPQPDGSMHSKKLRLNRMLRAAIARAGLLEGYEQRCRAAHCGWRERRPDTAVADLCPRCGKPTLWVKPIPRHVRFHDTRHSGGTAMVKGAGMAVAQKFLRHSDVRLTIHTYGHLDVEDVRAGMTKAFAAAQPEADHCKSLRNRPEDAGAPSPEPKTTAEKRAQRPDSASESRHASLRTHARTARSAAWARTRCSSAA